jgi:plasmid stabilization system protein ParE
LWTVGAEANLLDAIEFVAADNPNAAHCIVAEIRSKVELLTWSPGIGKSGRVPDTRELVVGGTPISLFIELCKMSWKSCGYFMQPSGGSVPKVTVIFLDAELRFKPYLARLHARHGTAAKTLTSIFAFPRFTSHVFPVISACLKHA